MFEMSEETLREYRAGLLDQARERVAEPVVAAAVLRRGGAATKMGISHAGLGGLAYAGASLFHRGKAGGLPDKTLFVATPTRLHAFKARIKGRGFRIGDEVAVWERAGLRARTESKMGLTMLTIESGDGAVTMAPVGVRDDAVSLELMRVLVEAEVHAPAPGPRSAVS
jgi:hypothetical protein